MASQEPTVVATCPSTGVPILWLEYDRERVLIRMEKFKATIHPSDDLLDELVFTLEYVVKVPVIVEPEWIPTLETQRNLRRSQKRRPKQKGL